MSEILTTEEFRAHTAGNCGCCQGNAECADVPGSDGCCHDADDRRHGRMTLSEWESGCDCHTMMRHDAALRAENERLRAAATEALAVLTRLADSAAYWSDYDVPVGIVAEIDAAKARLAGVLS